MGQGRGIVKRGQGKTNRTRMVSRNDEPNLDKLY